MPAAVAVAEVVGQSEQHLDVGLVDVVSLVVLGIGGAQVVEEGGLKDQTPSAFRPKIEDKVAAHLRHQIVLIGEPLPVAEGVSPTDAELRFKLKHPRLPPIAAEEVHQVELSTHQHHHPVVERVLQSPVALVAVALHEEAQHGRELLLNLERKRRFDQLSGERIDRRVVDPTAERDRPVFPQLGGVGALLGRGRPQQGEAQGEKGKS